MQRDDPDEFPLPYCSQCGDQLIEGSHRTCNLCGNPMCDWCYDDHRADCEADNGRSGVGA